MKNKSSTIKSQKGFYVEFLSLIVGFIVLAVSLTFIENIRLADVEIPASYYKHLSELASQSCSGAKELKTIVIAGAITHSKYEQIVENLEKYKELQGKLNERAKITKSNIDCV